MMKGKGFSLPLSYDFTTYPQRQKFTFATCQFFTRGAPDRIEVYLDEIATAAYQANTEAERVLGIAPGGLDLTNFISYLIAGSIVHEWLHSVEGLEERQVAFATDDLEKAVLRLYAFAESKRKPRRSTSKSRR
jgi:hypothetical protein